MCHLLLTPCIPVPPITACVSTEASRMCIRRACSCPVIYVSSSNHDSHRTHPHVQHTHISIVEHSMTTHRYTVGRRRKHLAEEGYVRGPALSGPPHIHISHISMVTAYAPTIHTLPRSTPSTPTKWTGTSGSLNGSTGAGTNAGQPARHVIYIVTCTDSSMHTWLIACIQ